jgi:hypothetical protein
MNRTHGREGFEGAHFAQTIANNSLVETSAAA